MAELRDGKRYTFRFAVVLTPPSTISAAIRKLRFPMTARWLTHKAHIHGAYVKGTYLYVDCTPYGSPAAIVAAVIVAALSLLGISLFAFLTFKDVKETVTKSPGIFAGGLVTVLVLIVLAFFAFRIFMGKQG